MAVRRLKVTPKITSQRQGWMARVTSSVRSWRSFCSSTTHMAQTRARTVRAPKGRSGSAQAAGGAASGTDIAHSSLLVVGGVLRVGPEHVVERGAVDPGDQLGRGPDSADGAAVHEGD